MTPDLINGKPREAVWPASWADVLLRTGMLGVLAASLASVTARVGAAPPPLAGSAFGMFAFAAYASVAAHFACRIGIDTKFVSAMAAAVTTASLTGVIRGSSPIGALKLLLLAAGAAGLASYVWAAASATTGRTRARAIAGLAEALMVPAAIAQVTFYLWIDISRNPIFDAFIYDFERRLGVPFEQIVASTFRSSVVAWPSIACYLALPIGLAAISGALRDRTSGLRLIAAAVMVGALGFFLYRIAPATGPRDAFTVIDVRDLPLHSSNIVAPIWTPGGVPRNAMPSLHAAWALLLVLGASPLGRRWRLATWVFAGLNVWAAIGRYQHWCLDIVVAVPLATAVYCGVMSGGRVARRAVASALSLGMTLAWLLAFRHGWTVPVTAAAARLLVLATLAIPAILARWAGRTGPPL